MKRNKIKHGKSYCMVCGTEKNLTEHHVFPRKHKNRNKALTVLCLMCHTTINEWWAIRWRTEGYLNGKGEENG